MQKYIAQGIGFVGMALVFVAFQQNDKRRLLWIQAGSAVVFAAHFLLLGALTGMAMNLLEVPRNILFSKERGRRAQVILAVVFVSLFAAIGIITWDSPMSIFPILAMGLSTVVFSLRKPRTIRFCTVPVSVFWIVYNIASLSIAGVITESICLLSIIIAIFRYDIKKKQE